MNLKHKLQECEVAIKRLSSPVSPPQKLTWWDKLKRWLRQLGRWLAGWWRR